jgi:starch-binding outer membrane protein, SusD/RagB family
MKKPYQLFTILMIAASGMLFSGCKKQLEEEVYSEILDENFTPTSNDVLALISPVYSIMRLAGLFRCAGRKCGLYHYACKTTGLV